MAALSSTESRELDVGVLHPSGGQSSLESGPHSRRSRWPLCSCSHGCKWTPKSVPHVLQGATWLAVGTQLRGCGGCWLPGSLQRLALEHPAVNPPMKKRFGP